MLLVECEFYDATAEISIENDGWPGTHLTIECPFCKNGWKVVDECLTTAQ